MRTRGVGWYLASVVVAIIPFGALTIEHWVKAFHTLPSLDGLLGAGDAFLVAVAIIGQGVIDAWRLGTGEHVERRAKICGIVVGLLSTLAAMAISALWAVTVFTQDPNKIYPATAHTCMVLLAVAIVFGALMASLREGSMREAK